MSNYVTNGEWYLKRAFAERNEVVYPISDAIYPDVTFTLVMQRRVLYYVLNILFPCICLNVLSLLTFCLPAESGEKVSFGITVLLSYSVFMLLVAENMPSTSEFTPLIGELLLCKMSNYRMSRDICTLLYIYIYIKVTDMLCTLKRHEEESEFKNRYFLCQNRNSLCLWERK